MNKILMVADVHLGATGRLRDIMWSLRVVREYGIRNGIDTIVSLGDMFHDRTAIPLDVMCEAYEFFAESKRIGHHWITYPGNHDMYLRHSWKVNSLVPFRDVMTIIETVKVLVINGVRFWILPFIQLESSYMKVLRRIEELYQEGDILLTHIGTVNAIKNVCFLLKDWSCVTFHDSPFKQVYTGHFHMMQQVGSNVWYPGSLIPFKQDEGNCSHGFFVYDLDSRSHEYVDIWEVGAEYFPSEVPPPNFLTVTEEIVDEIGRDLVNNNMMRILVNDEYTDNKKAELEKKLLDLGARRVSWVSLASEETQASVRMKLAAADGRDLFEEWLKVDAANVSGLDLDLLRKLHGEVAQEADDAYEYDDE